MISKKTLQFLKGLRDNNNKPWFDEHKEDYQQAKEEFTGFVQRMLDRLASIEPALSEQQPKDCIFRIFRDVRFSKDKTPYKAHFGAYFSRGGRKYPGAGYYVQIEPGGNSFAGGGLWMPEGKLLKAVRQEIDYCYDEFSAIISYAGFRKQFKGLEGEQLKTVPQGYTADNPAIGYLRMKSFIASRNFTDTEVMSEHFREQLSETFSSMKDLVDFLNRPLEH